MSNCTKISVKKNVPLFFLVDCDYFIGIENLPTQPPKHNHKQVFGPNITQDLGQTLTHKLQNSNIFFGKKCRAMIGNNLTPFDTCEPTLMIMSGQWMTQNHLYMGVSKNRGVSPQIINSNRVFPYFHHPFWGFSPYFWKHPHGVMGNL